MKHVLNTKPNAAALNSGIEFQPYPKGGMISVEPVTDEVAARFASIPGYKILEDKDAQKAAKEAADAKKAAEQKAAKEAEAAAKAAEKEAADKQEPAPKGK